LPGTPVIVAVGASDLGEALVANFAQGRPCKLFNSPGDSRDIKRGR
jgi:hypothetical protein